MTTAMTWDKLHIGDVVRGADGNPWEITAREPGPKWIGSGIQNDMFTLRFGERSVTAAMPLAGPVPVIHHNDHSEVDSAMRSLGAQFDVKYLGERVSDAKCDHAPETISKLPDGRHFCTACQRFLASDHPALDAFNALRAAAETPAAVLIGPNGEAHDASGLVSDITPAKPAKRTRAKKAAPAAAPVPPIPAEQAGDPTDPDGWMGPPPQSVPSPPTAGDPFTPPATAAKRIEFDSYGRYKLPDPVTGEMRSWTRATTIARTLADEYNLTQWKLRTAVKGLALRPDLAASAAAADPDEDKGTLNDLVAKAMEAAEGSKGANYGTALHAFARRLNRGESIAAMKVPPPLDKDLEAYAAALKAHRLEVRPELCERVVVVPELGVAGTFDNLFRQPPGEVKAKPFGIGDLKTGKDLSYSWLEIAIQLAIYSRATHMYDPETGTYTEMPADLIDRDRGLIIHLPVGQGSATVYAVNLIDGWRHVQTAMAVRAARSSAKGLAWLVDPDPAALLLQRVRIAPNRAELARLWEQGNKAGLWSEDVNAAAHARMGELAAA